MKRQIQSLGHILEVKLRVGDELLAPNQIQSQRGDPPWIFDGTFKLVIGGCLIADHGDECEAVEIFHYSACSFATEILDRVETMPILVTPDPRLHLVGVPVPDRPSLIRISHDVYGKPPRDFCGGLIVKRRELAAFFYREGFKFYKQLDKAWPDAVNESQPVPLQFEPDAARHGIDLKDCSC